MDKEYQYHDKVHLNEESLVIQNTISFKDIINIQTIIEQGTSGCDLCGIKINPMLLLDVKMSHNYYQSNILLFVCHKCSELIISKWVESRNTKDA